MMSLLDPTQFCIVPHVMRFSVLGSGSGGNAAVVDCGELRLMIDAGLSAKQLTLRLHQVGIDPSSLDGILLTHEHGDHVRGLKVFLKQYPTPVFATPSTARVVRESGIEGGTWKSFEPNQTFSIADATVEAFGIPHDAVDPVGFIISHGPKRLGFLSDVGFVNQALTERLRGLHGIFVEANYDDSLLAQDTKRPWSTKQRISSRHGHLSNSQVTELIRNIAHPGLLQIILGHLSSDCNRPDIIQSMLRDCLTDLGHDHVACDCAGQDDPSPWFTF